MKKLSIFLLFFISISTIIAQTPQKMSYQAIVRDAENNLVTNQSIGLLVKILQGSADGTVVYEESMLPQTNSNGLISVEIGSSEGFDTINWADGPYFIETNIDITGGTDYTITGTSQLLAVPYALHALTAENVTNVNYNETDPVFAASVAAGITNADTANWNAKLNAEIDGDTINEIQDLTLTDDTLTITNNGNATPIDLKPYLDNTDNQTLSISGQELSISGGNTVTLPSGSGGDDWGSQTVVSDATLNGDGTTANPLSVNGDLTDDQELSLSNDILSIDNGNNVDLSSYGNDWKLSGNSGTTAGTDFIGTIDYQDLDFRTYNTLKMRLTTKGQLEFYNNGSSVFIGEGAGFNDDLSNNMNIAVGKNALYSSVSSSNNIAIGSESLYQNSSGNYNTAISFQVLYNNLSGGFNTGIGGYSLYGNTGGSYNTAIGNNALFQNTTGEKNTACGEGSLSNNKTGNYNTAIGQGSGPSGDNFENTTALGYQAYTTASNMVAIGNTAVTWIGGEVTWSTYSDKRMKTDIEEDVKGLDFIMKLRPVTYKIDVDEQNRLLGIEDTTDYKEKYDIENMKISGFIAQEVAEAAKTSGYDFSGVTIPKGSRKLYSLSYAQFVIPLVKATQEQQQIIEKLQKQNEELNKTIEELTERIEKLEQKE